MQRFGTNVRKIFMYMCIDYLNFFLFFITTTTHEGLNNIDIAFHFQFHRVDVLCKIMQLISICHTQSSEVGFEGSNSSIFLSIIKKIPPNEHIDLSNISFCHCHIIHIFVDYCFVPEFNDCALYTRTHECFIIYYCMTC